jgi:hypothetical protein
MPHPYPVNRAIYPLLLLPLKVTSNENGEYFKSELKTKSSVPSKIKAQLE